MVISLLRLDVMRLPIWPLGNTAPPPCTSPTPKTPLKGELTSSNQLLISHLTSGNTCQVPEGYLTLYGTRNDLAILRMDVLAAPKRNKDEVCGGS